MVCPNCGEPIEQVDRFCGECGIPLGQKTTPYDPNKTVLSPRYRTTEEAHTVPLNDPPEREKTMALPTQPESPPADNQHLRWLVMGVFIGTFVIICMLITAGLVLITAGLPQ